MKFFAFINQELIYWKLVKTDPFLYELKSMPNFFLVNPLLYPELLGERNKYFSHILGLISETEAIVQSHGLIIGSEKDEFDVTLLPNTISERFSKSNFKLDEEYVFNKIEPYFEIFCKSAREISKQATLSYKCMKGILFENGDMPKKMKFPKFHSTGITTTFRKYPIQSALSWSQLNLIDENISKTQTTIYEKLFLDALQAYKETDYKKCLLYSSMTVEILAKTVIDEFYEQKLNDIPFDEELRLTKITVTAKESIVKDPVFEMLRKSSRNNLKSYFHEIPLYLLKRSIHLENDKLFQQILKLINTRNSIAHSGKPHQDEDLFYESMEDSLEALKCGIEVFKWFE